MQDECRASSGQGTGSHKSIGSHKGIGDGPEHLLTCTGVQYASLPEPWGPGWVCMYFSTLFVVIDLLGCRTAQRARASYLHWLFGVPTAPLQGSCRQLLQQDSSSKRLHRESFQLKPGRQREALGPALPLLLDNGFPPRVSLIILPFAAALPSSGLHIEMLVL